MASDPERDLLPVKESFLAGTSDRVDLNLVTRFKRGDLEDRFIRIYEENNEFKRLINAQDIKIKKLGTKLLRLSKENKKSSTAQYAGPDEDDWKVKIHELERENFALKDKNTILKQQLASHSKQHMAAHRSPVHVNRMSSSSRMSIRQASVPNIDEVSYTSSTRHNSEMQLRDAEVHISSLNQDVKSLHSQVESLQRELEHCHSSSQKAQLNENIELIKLRRQKKQLEAQCRTLEHSQKVLQQDVARLQKENEDALQIVAEKQNKIIDLQTKLDEALRLQLDCQELKDIVEDVTSERNILKERCDELLKAAMVTQEPCVPSSLKNEITELREQVEQLRLQNNHCMEVIRTGTAYSKTTSSTQTGTENRLWSEIDSNVHENISNSHGPYNILDQLAKLSKPNLVPSASNSDKENPSTAITVPSEPIKTNSVTIQTTPDADIKRLSAVNVKLQGESEMLKEVVSGQKHHIETLETQIIRLRQEMRMKDERCKDIFQQRDLFFRLLDKDSYQSLGEKNRGGISAQATSPEQNGTYTKSSPSRIGILVSSNDEAEFTKTATFTKSSPVKNNLSPRKQLTKSPIRNIEEKVLSDKSSLNSESLTTKVPVPTPKPRATSNAVTANGTSTKIIVTKETSNSKAQSPKKLVTLDSVKNNDEQSVKMTVNILWLSLDKDGTIMKDSTIQAIYVDFTVLGRSDGFETQQAVKKPQAGEKATFDVSIDVPWDDKLRQKLKSAKERPLEDVIVFNIISEPDGDSTEVQCPVVGVSGVSFNELSFAEAENELLLPVYDQTKERAQCGTLAVALQVPPIIFHHL